MAAHTKIVDLFGIPACGKTTLVDFFCNHHRGDYNVVSFQIALQEIRNKGYLRLVSAFSFRILFSALKVRFSAPFDKKRKVIPFMKWLKHGIYYNYLIKKSNYDVVLVDHGDIQSFVSLERGEDLHNNRKFSDACAHYIEVSPATHYVYCQVEPQTALGRMRRRHREKGRIDTMDNHSHQMWELKKEGLRFDYFANLLSEKKRRLIRLCMNDEIPILVGLLETELMK